MKKEDSFKLLFADVNKQYAKLNEHSIWMIIATLACWGVSNRIVQMAGIVIVFTIYIYQLLSIEKALINSRIKRFKALKDKQGLHLTSRRLKLVKQKMRQTDMHCWITVICFLFVWVSFFLIGFNFGLTIATSAK